MANFNFSHKTAVVTGAAGGIGQAVAEKLAEKGANLAAPAPSPVRVRTLLLARAPAALAEGIVP
mgnify:CR=1 FL=1